MFAINRNPSRRELQQFGIIWLCAFSLLAVVLAWRRGWYVAAGIVETGAVIVPLVGWMYLPAMRWAYLGLHYVTFPIGFVVSHLLLAIVYFGVITPIGLALRMCGYDPMERKRDPSADSYWMERGDEPAKDRYFQQF